MAAINDLIAQIKDEDLRLRIEAEVKRLLKHKKFGLVFEDHLPEGLTEGSIYPCLRMMDQVHHAPTAFSVIVRDPEAAETILKDPDTMQKTMQKTMRKDPNTIQKAMQKAINERGISITDLQIDILVYFYLHPKATRNDYISSDENISEGGTKSNISRLQELELLKRQGGKKNGEWIVCIELSNDDDI